MCKKSRGGGRVLRLGGGGVWFKIKQFLYVCVCGGGGGGGRLKGILQQ